MLKLMCVFVCFSSNEDEDLAMAIYESLQVGFVWNN